MVENIKFVYIFQNDSCYTFQRKFGLQEEVTYDETATCCGKTICDFKNNYYVIVLRAEILNIIMEQICNGVSQSQSIKWSRELNIIHHELGHIHDFTMNRKIKEAVNELSEHIFIPAGLILWEEYFATRLSAKSMCKDQKFGFRDVTYYYESTLTVFDRAIADYKVHNNMSILYNAVTPDIMRLMIAYCETFGYLDELVSDNEMKVKLLYENVENIYEAKYLDIVWSELRTLHHNYQEWEFPNDLKKLAKAYYECWSIFGVKVNHESYGLVLNIL